MTEPELAEYIGRGRGKEGKGLSMATLRQVERALGISYFYLPGTSVKVFKTDEVDSALEHARRQQHIG